MMGIATRRETGVNCRDGRSPRGARILGNNGEECWLHAEEV